VDWKDYQNKNAILFSNLALVLTVIGGAVLSILFASRAYQKLQSDGTPLIPADLTSISELSGFVQSFLSIIEMVLPIIIPMVVALGIILYLRKHLNWDIFDLYPSFQLLILASTLVLPLLAPFPVRFTGADPSAYSDIFSLLLDYFFIAYFFGISIIIGAYVFPENWWKYALVFYGIYGVLYSTFFTNTTGLVTGMVGSLGHWLAQQDVQRGGQPLYYYAFILIPIYEFLGAAGTILAFILGWKNRSFWMAIKIDTEEELTNIEAEPAQITTPMPAIFLYWTVTSLAAFTLAGEKMPWLSVHIVFPMLLVSGWAVNEIFKKITGNNLLNHKNGWLKYLELFIFISASIYMLVRLWGSHAPFQGRTLQQLQDTNLFIFNFILLVFFGYRIKKNFTSIGYRRVLYTSVLLILFILSLVTFRSAYRASFINYDYPLEFLVYAHAADGPKIVLEQIETISRRTTRGLDIEVAYDNHGLYPYWWYLRNYPNKNVYLENPTRTLEEAPLIIAGQDKYAKLEPIVKDNYHTQEYMRLWWPMQDYWNLTWERITNAFSKPDMRQALFDIWFNRDYSLYAEITNNKNLTLPNWLPSEKMKLYIRKDIAAQMWDYPSLEGILVEAEQDPYSGAMVSRQPDYFISMSGEAAGNLKSPRGISIAPDGTIYVADSVNHRIQQFSQTGELINSWGDFANVLEGDAPGGTFNEPWDVAVSQDGSIFVADTFNHRVQKFNNQGEFIKAWGVFAQGTSPDSFWGPRGIAVGPDGNVYITDTGNKRVVVFDQNLDFISQFGGGGFEAGEFDEPVGIDVNDSGLIYVADTWNRRVQVFSGNENMTEFTQISEFDVEAWFGQSIDNKPYISVRNDGNILVSDPELGRILEFSPDGSFIRGLQDISISPEMMSRPYGLDFDTNGNLWVTDGQSDVIMRFSLE